LAALPFAEAGRQKRETCFSGCAACASRRICPFRGSRLRCMGRSCQERCAPHHVPLRLCPHACRTAPALSCRSCSCTCAVGALLPTTFLAGAPSVALGRATRTRCLCRTLGRDAPWHERCGSQESPVTLWLERYECRTSHVNSATSVGTCPLSREFAVRNDPAAMTLHVRSRSSVVQSGDGHLVVWRVRPSFFC
jgi:hypothetical protein